MSFDNDGFPVIANNAPSDPNAGEDTKIRLIVTDQTDPQATKTLLFKRETIKLPEALFAQFPDYYSRTISKNAGLKEKTQTILDAYDATVSSNGLGVSWWNQIAVSIDNENSSRVRNDLLLPKSEILGWIKDNAASQNDAAALPEGLSENSQIDLSPLHPTYHDSNGTDYVFVATDAVSGARYELRLDVADFKFTGVATDPFESGSDLVAAVPSVQLGSGSVVNVTARNAEGTEETTSIPLRTNA